MTTSPMVRRPSELRAAEQPQALQMVAIQPGTASALESVTGAAITAFSGAADGASILAALDLAAAVNDMRSLFDRPEIRARIVALQDTPLGFRTDCDPKVKRRRKNQSTGQWSEVANTPYPYEIVKEAAIEALLRRLQLAGNQFNIIAGRFYCTKEGFEALIRQLPSVANFRPIIGVPQAKTGGVIVDCSATWLQDGEPQSLEASIPVKTDDYSTADQSIGKATRKFLKRCYECMTGNSMPEGDALESADGPVAQKATFGVGPLFGADVPPSAPAPAPALAAAAAPVVTLTEPQLTTLNTALERQLSPVGRAAFAIDACSAFGVQELAQIPADQHTALMGSLANAGNRERWNRGCGHQAMAGSVLSAEQIAELTPQPVAQPQRTRQPAATAPAAEATPAEPAEQPDEQVDGDDLQGELV